jgi:hypothetical protein
MKEGAALLFVLRLVVADSQLLASTRAAFFSEIVHVVHDVVGERRERETERRGSDRHHHICVIRVFFRTNPAFFVIRVINSLMNQERVICVHQMCVFLRGLKSSKSRTQLFLSRFLKKYVLKTICEVR